MMPQPKTLEIRLLGGLSLTLDGALLTKFKSRKAEALLAYLALAKRPLSRTELAYLFWEESNEEQSRRNLRRTLSDLRQQTADWLTVTRHTIAFNQDADYWLDVEAVQAGLAQLPSPNKTDLLTSKQACDSQESLSHYHGELLGGVYLVGARPFEEWVTVERERLRLQVHDALYRLAEYYLYYGRYQEGILQARRLTRLDPLREDGHMLLLRLYVRAGQRNAALKHHADYQQMLAAELAVEPEPEMVELVARIQSHAIPATLTLPTYPNPFIGREREQAQLDYLLDTIERPFGKHLVTLLGSGGVGKTRLAVETMRQRQTEYEHGICFAPLAGVTTAVQLPTALILALNLSPSTSQTPRQQLLDVLGQRHMLLVLDNIEHLLPEAVSLLQDLLAAAPRLTLLVTSRNRLYLQTEAILSLRGLAYPESETAVIDQFAAVQLLQQRASHLVQDQPLDSEAARHICNLVAGLPLALELAAASFHDHTPGEVAEAIQQNFDFLTSKMHDAPDRQRSLRAVFAYSWALLTPTQQAMFAQLALFADGFTVEAAQKVAKAAKSALQKLVDKSLVTYTEISSATCSSGRYTIHTSLRQFALEQLTDNELETTKACFISYFASWMAQQQPILYGKNPQNGLAQIDGDIDNVRQAWEWAIMQDSETAVSQTLTSLHRYYHIRSWYDEGAAQFAAAVADITLPHLQMRLQNRQADFLYRLGELEQAAQLFQQTQSFFAETNDAIEEAFACLGLHRVTAEQGDSDQSRQWVEQSLHLSQQANDLPGQAAAFSRLGSITQDKGEFEAAQEYYQSALTLYEQIQDEWRMVGALNNIGMIAGTLGQYDEAKSHFEHTLILCRQMNDRFGQARAIQNLSIIAFIDGSYTEAKKMRLAVLAICQEVGFQWGVASSLRHLGDVERKLGEVEVANNYYEQSLPIWQAMGNERNVAFTHNSIGNLYLELAQYETANSHFQQAIQSATVAQIPPVAVAALAGQAQVLAAQEEFERAVRLLSFALCHPACEKQLESSVRPFLAEWMEMLPEKTAVAAQAEGERLAAAENGLDDVDMGGTAVLRTSR